MGAVLGFRPLAPMDNPKVILFDIGGVCVVSPFQAILDYEVKLGIPPGWVNHSISRTSPNGFWHKLERGEIPMDKEFFAGFNRDLHDRSRWEVFYKAQAAKNPSLPKEVPPLPKLDGEWLFNDMMREATQPDPWMLPALENLRKSGRYILAAVSNTVIFPKDHPLYREDFFADPIRKMFDVFVSSAHVGLRKPDPRIYELTMAEINKYAAREYAANNLRAYSLQWKDGIKPEQVVFLDDIGENLKAAKKMGIRTIKVPLGMTYKAVAELEEATWLQLAGDHPKIPAQEKNKAKMSKL